MSTYTTMIRWLVEENFDFQLNEYPIFDESYRPILNKKILDHYYFHEIGMETAANFRFYLKATMNEIMPYYNQMYKSELLTFDPLMDYLYEEISNRDTAQDTLTDILINQDKDVDITFHGDVADNVDGNSKNIKSDTPQGLLSINDIESDLYASVAELDHSAVDTNRNNDESTNNVEAVDTTSINVGNMLNNENYFKNVKGKLGGESYSDLLTKFRSTFLNIDMLIIGELEDLFMQIL